MAERQQEEDDPGFNFSRLSGVQNVVLGVSAGVLCKGINYPILVFKNKSQQNKPIVFNRTVYQGLTMACINLGGTTGIQFVLTGAVQKQLTDGGRTPLTRTKEIKSALIAGLFSGIPSSMWELTMVQQQNNGGTIIGTAQRVVKASGLTGALRGMTMTCGREGVYTMAMLGLCPVLTKELQERFQVGEAVALAGGSIATAVVAATASHPMDTIKTCMQGDILREKYGNIVQTGQALVAEHGLAKGLFAGLTWRIALITSTFFLVNGAKTRLAPVMFG
eukprot:m.142790 g.142790  ORF g.142790 m.142790 type:complete len:277 (-) comp30271_c1_seq1:76-906(-)